MVLHRCLGAAAWLIPMLVAVLVLGCLLALPAAAPGQEDRVAAAPWLHVPMFLATAVLCATAIETWPAFSRDRPGAAWLLRLRRGALRGCGGAVAGCLLILLPAVAILATAAVLTVPGMPAPRIHHRLDATGDGLLDATRTALEFRGGADVVVEVRLRPVAVMPRDDAPEATRLVLALDGVLLPMPPVAVAGSHQLLRIPLAAQPVGSLRVERVAGTLPLLFPPGAVEVVTAGVHSPVVNAAIAALGYALAGLVALTAACVGAPVLALPVNQALMLVILLLTTLGGLLPVRWCIDTLLRGRWLPTESLPPNALVGLAAAAAGLLLAAIVRRGSDG